MPSTGIDRRTGKVLRGIDHLRQSAEVIFTTHFGARVMREEFGSNVPPILGRSNLTPVELLRFYAAIHVALKAWEPRVDSLRAYFPKAQNTPEGARAGKLGLRITVKYYPNALQGDFTSDVVTLDL